MASPCVIIVVMASALSMSAVGAPSKGGLQYRRLPGSKSEDANASKKKVSASALGNEPVASNAPTCCAQCTSSAYCSPVSGHCYDSRSKDYYESCGGGGLAPPPPPPSSSCCGSCVGHDFCSSVSNHCYDTKAKDYYLSCKAMVVDTLVWSDEFEDPLGDGIANSSKWFYDNGPNPANLELQYYTDRPENSRVENGSLKIAAKCEEYNNNSHRYTSARLNTRGMGEWGPGHRVEVRAKMPVGIGTWPAIWMLPSASEYGIWPHSGEIDIMESVGCDAGQVYGTVHTGAFNHMKSTQVGRNYYCDYGAWQTYTIDWEDHMIKWYTNGILYHTFAPDTSSSAEWPFDKTFYLVLNVAVGGTWGGYCLSGANPSCTSDDHFRGDQVMEVDYVRVYTLKPSDDRRLSAKPLSINSTFV